MGINEVEKRVHHRLKWPPFEIDSSKRLHLPILKDLAGEEYASVNLTDDDQIGEVTHYYYRINVAVLSLKDRIRIGDKVHIFGYTTDFVQRVTSLQIEHQPIKAADCGQEVAMQVDQRVRRGDKIFKIG